MWHIVIVHTVLIFQQSWVKFSVALRPQRPYGLLGPGNPGRPSRLSHSSWPLSSRLLHCCFTSTESKGLLGTGSPGWPPRLLHSSWALQSWPASFTYILKTVSVSQVWRARVACRRKGTLRTVCDKHCVERCQNFAWLECSIQMSSRVSSIKDL